MDYRHRPTSRRSLHATQDVAVPTHFEWTRQPGIGPGLAILGELQGQTVVEVGCGGGHNLAHLVAYHGVTGIGVDHDAEKITRARLAYSHLPSIGSSSPTPSTTWRQPSRRPLTSACPSSARSASPTQHSCSPLPARRYVLVGCLP